MGLFVLSPTSPAEKQRFDAHGRKLVRAVRRLETLRELSHDEAHAAFWAGAKLAHDYLPQICRAALGGDCPKTVPLPPPPPVPGG